MPHPKPGYQFDVRQAMRDRPIERLLLLNHRLKAAVSMLGITGLTCLIYPRFIAPFRLKVRQHAMTFRNLPPEFHGYKILHLTDLHLGSTRTSFVRHAIETGLAHKPDLILLSGDLIEYRRAGLTALGQILPLLRAPDGVLTIFGNHDYHESSWRHVGERSAHRAIHKRLTKLVQNSPVTLLRNESRIVQRANAKLQIVGIDEMWVGHMDPAKAFQGVDPALPTIVLQHNPDGYLALKEYAWEWMLCGHTHGGQVDVPLLGPLYVPMINRQWLRGFYEFINESRFQTHHVRQHRRGLQRPRPLPRPPGNCPLHPGLKVEAAFRRFPIRPWQTAQLSVHNPTAH